MKILIFTQKVDIKDPVLGFFHEWIDKLSYHFESVEVICLQKGESNLPKNVSIHVIGKEVGINKIKYVYKVYKFLHELHGKYDRVFVHMNQEYVLLGGVFWRFKNIPVYLWRNHSKGNILTRVSVLLSQKVFCTSKDSFTARYKKTVVMPAGIDTDFFKANPTPSRKKYSVCMVGRISPVKHIDLGLKAIKELVDEGVQVNLSIIGPVPVKDEKYFEGLKKYVEDNSLKLFVNFLPAVEYNNLPGMYNEYQICLNLTDTGSFDKTIVEASSCGSTPLTTNSSMKDLLPKECVVNEDLTSIKNGIRALLDDHVRLRLQSSLESFAKSQSLQSLLSKLLQEIGNV